MGDFIPGRDTRTKGVEVGRVFTEGQEAEIIFGRGTQIFPNLPVAIWGMLEARMVLDLGERWFEMGFTADMSGVGSLTGNSGAGWTDSGSYLRLEYEWSANLVTWQLGKFYPAPVREVDLGNGVFQYWGRAVNPQDSQIKTGALFFDNGGSSPDARNNGFTSVVIAGVALALPNFPYNMATPGTAAQLQADIRAAGFPGTIVTGTSAVNWTVAIPSVSYTSFAQTSWIGFPGYLVEDQFGQLTITVDRINAQGTFVDGFGVPTFPGAFGRLKISPGVRYNPYLKL